MPTAPTARLARRLAVCLVVLAAALAPAAPAAAATGCTRTSNHAGYATYNCYMYKTSTHSWDMWQNSTRLQIIDNLSGVLYAGTSWFVCQRTFGVTFQTGNAVNNYWAYTLSDTGRWGWINAIYISGGDNYGPVPGLPKCASAFGSTSTNPHTGGAYNYIDTSPNDAALTTVKWPLVIWG
ncbi:hypothetical protein GCM10009682_41130 [Luedemannella flava]|uniref:Secreted protein n=1 Tax=Luedemannella flava TaxID=349316 RepID=A0ABN2MA48_9ACTN